MSLCIYTTHIQTASDLHVSPSTRRDSTLPLPQPGYPSMLTSEVSFNATTVIPCWPQQTALKPCSEFLSHEKIITLRPRVSPLQCMPFVRRAILTEHETTARLT